MTKKFIYKTTNNINGKIYIGKRSGNVNRFYLGSGKILKLAISKYGINNFSREILEYCDTNGELAEREIYWIKKLGSQDRNIGYNILDGGFGGWDPSIWKDRKHTEETRKKISDNHHDVTGENNPMYNKKHSDESRLVMRNKQLGKKAKEETKKLMSSQRFGENNPKSKLTEEDVRNIRYQNLNGMSTSDILKMYPVKKACIWKILKNRTWKNI